MQHRTLSAKKLKGKTKASGQRIKNRSKKTAKSLKKLPKTLAQTTLYPGRNIGFERQRISSLINSMVDAVIAVDENYRINLYNASALSILDVNADLTDKYIHDICKIIDKKDRRIDFHGYIAETVSQRTSNDFRLAYPDGSDINVYLSVAAVSMGFGRGGKRGYIIIMRDITHEKSLEEERDEFISVVSHELRTPIAIAEGNISNAEFIVGKSHKDSQVNDALKQAHNQILFLGGLINDLSTLSRAERGKLNVAIEAINTHELVCELAQNYEPQAKTKNLEIRVETDPHLELLHSSKLYVREILQNFITNSIKYTDKGSVTISARNAHAGIRFEVTDTGIGISKGDQPKVFDKFFRSEDYRTRASSGTGLGLYVTMKLTRLLHAELSLDSRINEGSTFTIYFPNLNGKKKH
jgi:PAS domain S-box-containing protein